MPILTAHPASFWFTLIWLCYGFASVVVLGGMWSLCELTCVTIFMMVVRRVASMAFRTLALSAWVRVSLLPLYVRVPVSSRSLQAEQGRFGRSGGRELWVRESCGKSHHSQSWARRPSP